MGPVGLPSPCTVQLVSADQSSNLDVNPSAGLRSHQGCRDFPTDPAQATSCPGIRPLGVFPAEEERLPASWGL